MLGFIRPLRIIERPKRLIIQDYRPTVVMMLCVAGFFVCLTTFVLLAFRIDAAVDSFGMWAAGIFATGCLALSFRGTIREVYYFDKTTDSYAFIRQFIHRKEVIEGGLSQFWGVEIRTITDGDRTKHAVILLQEGMFLTGATEQMLREEKPLLNLHSIEKRIVSAISRFLKIPRGDTKG